MDRFLAPHTPEALAHTHLTEHWNDWETDSLSTLVARGASYQAFSRYLAGADLFLLPRTRSELESILRRYSYDAIHNVVAKTRSTSTLERGGYSRACHLAEESIRAVLNTGDNVDILLALHIPPNETNAHDRERSATRAIETK